MPQQQQQQQQDSIDLDTPPQSPQHNQQQQQQQQSPQPLRQIVQQAVNQAARRAAHQFHQQQHQQPQQRQFVEPSFETNIHPLPRFGTWNELVDLCIGQNIQIDGARLLTEAESAVQQETVDWAFLYNSKKRVLINKEHAVALSRKPVTEVRLIKTLEECVRYHICINLRKKRQENKHYTMTSAEDENKVWSKATLVPVSYINKRRRIAEKYFRTIKNEDRSKEVRLRIRNKKVKPCMQLHAHCVEEDAHRSTVKACYAGALGYLPVGNLDDLLHGEIDIEWTNSWHLCEACLIACEKEFMEHQINLGETAENWKRDKAGCIIRRMENAAQKFAENRWR